MSWARSLAAELLAHYPNAFITDAHIDAIASDLERCGSEEVAGDVVSLLRLRMRTVPSSGDIAETLREVRRETMSPRQDIGYVPVEINSADLMAHGRFHLAELLGVPKEERTEAMREKAVYPQRCGCDQRAPAEKTRQFVP